MNFGGQTVGGTKILFPLSFDDDFVLNLMKVTDECLDARSLSGHSVPENDEDRRTRKNAIFSHLTLGVKYLFGYNKF